MVESEGGRLDPRHSDKLEYILDMVEQLAEIAGGMDENQLGGSLRRAAETRRGGNEEERRDAPPA